MLLPFITKSDSIPANFHRKRIRDIILLFSLLIRQKYITQHDAKVNLKNLIMYLCFNVIKFILCIS